MSSTAEFVPTSNRIHENGVRADWPWRLLPESWACTLTKPGYFALTIAVLCQVPYAINYLINLWSFTHYQFYPFVLIAVGYLVTSRFGGAIRQSNMELAVKVALTLASMIWATLLGSQWLGFLSFGFATWVALSAIRDVGTSHSLGYLALPLLLIWQPPFSDFETADVIFIGYLQRLSASFSSGLLDILGVVHYSQGTIIELNGQKFGVEEACSGIQSFFALLCFASLWAAYERRRWFFTAPLLLSTVVWAVVMNVVRISVIPLAHLVFGLDLSHGWPHFLLGFITFGLGLWLIHSTGAIIESCEGRIARFNANPKNGGSCSQMRLSGYDVSLFRLATPVFLVGSIVLAIQAMDFYRRAFRTSAGEMIVNLRSDALPQKESNLSLQTYYREDRASDANFGERSDIWVYQNDVKASFIVSVDQPFRVWHELTFCYIGTGWKLLSRDVVFLDDEKWPFVVGILQRDDGSQAVVAFSLFDRSGDPMLVPGHLSPWQASLQRIYKRLSNTLNEGLSENVYYQVQVFHISAEPIAKETIDLVKDLLMKQRERIRASVVARLSSEK